MKKSQLQELVREVLKETIRKVDGKFVVYPEKGGKRLGTHSTRKAAEKQLTAIHLNEEQSEEETVAIKLLDGVINGRRVVEAKVNGRKIGVLRVKPFKNGHQVDNVRVESEYQGFGIGKEMYRLAHEELGPLYSDYNQTEQAKFLWDSLIKKNEAKRDKDLGLFIMTGPTKNKQSVNEIGDSSKSPYSFYLAFSDHPNFRYVFKTDSEIDYRVYFEPTDSYQSSKDYSISFASKGNEGSGWWSFETVHSKGELYKIMSTIVAIIKDFLKLNPEVIKLSFTASPKSGEEKLDNKRSNLYFAYFENELRKALGGRKDSKVDIEPYIKTQRGSGLITIELPSRLRKNLEDRGEFSNVTYTRPDFEFEWDEAKRYSEFRRLGEFKWIELAQTGKAVTITSAKDINNTDAADPDAFKALDPDKQERALEQLEGGKVEMPIVALYPDGHKELIGGNTRLTALMGKYGRATIWQFEVPDNIVQENYADGKVKGETFSFKIKDRQYDDTDDSLISVEYSFSTPESTYRVEFYSGEYKPEDKTFELSFGLDEGDFNKIDTFQMTGEGSVRKIIHTIVQIIEDFVSKFDINKVKASATSDKRRRVYKAIFNSLSPSISDKVQIEENYADGKVKGKSRPGRVKKAGASCKGSVTDLRAKAKKYGGEKGKMYHWCANMKAGKK